MHRNRRAFRRVALSAAVLFLLPHLTSAAGTQEWHGSLTLSQAIARAERAGFPVRVAVAGSQAAAAQAAAARAALFPQASLGATTMNGGIAQLGMPVAQQNYVSVNASVPLFAPSAFESARAAGESAQAASYDTEQTGSDTMLEAVQAYEGTLLAQAIYEARETTVRYERRHVHDVSVMVKGGALPLYVLAESQAALEASVQSAEDAAAERDEAMNDLKVVLAFGLRSSISLAQPLQPLPISGAETMFAARALSVRPDVLAAQRSVAAARAQLAAARAAYLPVISASAQTYNGGSHPYLGNHGYEVGISASLSIIDGGSRSAAFHAAQANLAAAQAMLDQAELSARRDVANAWREYEAAVRNVRSAQIEETAAAQTLRITTLRERSGKGITLETLDTLAQDASAREAVLRAIARLNIAVASVHHAAGDTSIGARTPRRDALHSSFVPPG